jgi:two-component system chemotaxis sensor kinase CheA
MRSVALEPELPADHQPDTLPPDVLASIRLQFLQECEEHLVEFENGLLQLQTGSTDWEIVNAIFRAAHSIKGGAATFGMDRLVEFAHSLESTLATFRSRHSFPEPKLLTVLLRAVDVLADLVREVRDGDTLDQECVRSVSQDLATALQSSSPDGGAESDDLVELGFTPTPVSFESLDAEIRDRWIVEFRPHNALYATANEPLVLLRELHSLGDIEVDLDDSAVPSLSDLDPAEPLLAWTVSLSTSHDEAEIRQVFEFVDGLCDLTIRKEATESIQPAPEERASTLSEPKPIVRKDSAPALAPTIRVDLEKVDRLINLVSELVISEATLAERVLNADMTSAHTSGIAAAFDNLRHLTRDLQEYVMGVRAQPAKILFQRMPRLVREIEAQTGKSVRLVVHGEETEVDRALIEGLTDALTHMVRNAIDHGIEHPERRLKAGKPAQGVVRLNAAHRAGRVVIEVSDDGQGICRDKVRALAIQRGMISSADVLSDGEIDNLIFEPGLSTVDKVTDLSGRGVGMDVVRRSVQALGGRITVTSTPGVGTVLTLSLPLTLAVMDGMIASVFGQRLVIPLTTLLETIQVKESNIHRLGTAAILLTVHGRRVPLVDLGNLLGYGPSRDQQSSGVALLVEDDTGEQIALLVDDIPEQRQVVIKSLETNHCRVAGIAAATILGNGTVALILDVNSIVASRKVRPTPEMGLAVHA